jgi:hypothetical protein
MSDATPTERIELPEQDEADLHRLYAEPDGVEEPTFHPIMQVWREVLAPAATEREQKVTPQWANRIVSAYTQVTFGQMDTFRELYFGKLKQMANILDIEIAYDKDCLSYDKMEDDAVENADHYKNMLLVWQLQVLQWELDWETTAIDAAVELAAISEVHKMFFGQTGITQFLDNIGFEFTDDDSSMLMVTLEEFRGGDRE